MKAKTASGHIIESEAEIINWNNADDKIIGTFFVDRFGKDAEAVLSEEATNTIDSADVIIFSAGTQWSSLIPTYQHRLCKEALEHSKAKKYVVMNNMQDGDMIGTYSNELVRILCKYLPVNKSTFVFNEEADDSMRVDSLYMSNHGLSYLNGKFGTAREHNGDDLAQVIMKDVWNSGL